MLHNVTSKFRCYTISKFLQVYIAVLSLFRFKNKTGILIAEYKTKLNNSQIDFFLEKSVWWK